MARIAFFFLAFTVSQRLWAETYVQFDVPAHVSAEDVSSAEFLASHPDEKLIRISIPISTLLNAENETELLQCLFLISGSQTAPFQIVDYLPVTTLISDVEGLITTERADDQNTSLGLNTSAPRDLPFSANADARISSGSRVSERLSRLPAKHLLSASGTMHRGVSAYFKLKPTTQTTLEGSKHFVVTARVRASWRAGLIYVNCAAYGSKRQSAKGFIVGAYLSGDREAKNLVENLAMHQSSLKRLAARYANTIDERRFPSVAHRLGGSLSMVKPKIPNRWLNQMLTSNDYHRYERLLPKEIQHAATGYREARARVMDLAGKI